MSLSTKIPERFTEEGNKRSTLNLGNTKATDTVSGGFTSLILSGDVILRFSFGNDVIRQMNLGGFFIESSRNFRLKWYLRIFHLETLFGFGFN